jgi:hypothetical protein
MRKTFSAPSHCVVETKEEEEEEILEEKVFFAKE